MTVGGLTVTQDNSQGLEYLMVEDHLDMIGVCELSFKAGNDGQAPWSSFKVGDNVEVTVGSSSRKVFVGTIASLKHGQTKGNPSLTVKCMDPLSKVAATRNTKTWEDKSDSDVVNEILGNHGVTGTVDSTEGTPPKYTFQRNESDFAFIRRLASRNGYMVMANEGKVDFKKPQFSGQAYEVPKDKLINLDYNQNSRSIPQSIKVVGWDPMKKQKIEGTASSGDIQGIGSGSNSTETGGFSGEMVISDVQVSSQEDAKKMAVAELNRLARQGVQGRATVQGTGEIYAGGLMSLSQHKTGFNPEVLVVSARHRVHNKTGFVTEVTFCSNTAPK
ncbi:MAG: phage late control D family protein [Myxococcales bacterium]|nr:phage late control D family protein [Myxococcales bacterium]